jgi:hypothetical protein
MLLQLLLLVVVEVPLRRSVILSMVCSDDKHSQTAGMPPELLLLLPDVLGPSSLSGF